MFPRRLWKPYTFKHECQEPKQTETAVLISLVWLRAVQIRGMIDSVGLILLDKRALRPILAKQVGGDSEWRTYGARITQPFRAEVSFGTGPPGLGDGSLLRFSAGNSWGSGIATSAKAHDKNRDSFQER
jgi:hypothetical protein